MTAMTVPSSASGIPDLSLLDRKIEQMGGLCESQLYDAIDSLVGRDSALAEKVIANDKQVDRLERDVEEWARQCIASKQLEDAELRTALAAIKIASDLERIGDLAKNTSKRALVINRETPLRQGLAQGFDRMGRQASSQVKDVLDAFADKDADRAMAVWRHDEAVDELNNSLFKELLTDMAEDPRTIGSGVHLMFVAKNLERVGDHATNIAETIHYLVHGTHVSDKRPKGDTTSLTSVSFVKPD